jgi:heme A synthase
LNWASRLKSHGESGEERSQSRGAPILLGLIVLVCCGLPLLVIAAGSLTFLSAVTGSVVLLLTAAAVIVLVVVGLAIRHRNKGRRVKPSGVK